jgi:OOP family OmpA-OmpF porin
MKGRHTIWASIAVCLSTLVAAAQTKEKEDVKGSKDHPLVSRLAGSTIVKYDYTDFGDLDIPLSNRPDKDDTKRLHVEGRRTRIVYQLPPASSSHQAFRAYQTELEKAAFKSLYTCAGDQCGSAWALYVQNHMSTGLSMGSADWPSQSYLAASRETPEGIIYVMVFAVDFRSEKYAITHIIDAAPLKANLVTVNAEAMAKDITASGHVAIYGVYFDTDKAEIKPESKPALQEMQKLLAQNSTLKVYIVGHTDNVGILAHNMDLSQLRADAVVRALVSYGISANRLAARGVGPLAPVASNRSEVGRSKNRRVELVEQ